MASQSLKSMNILLRWASGAMIEPQPATNQRASATTDSEAGTMPTLMGNP
jgi:hypothetical protein